MICAVDANVVVAAYRVGEAKRAESRQFLARVLAQRAEIACPTIFLPECAGAVARGTGGAPDARKLLRSAQRLPRLRLVVVGVSLASRAAEIAITCRLRGADAVYVAVAERFSATLITWDTEMLQRAPAVVPTMTPADWLAQYATQEQ